MHKHFSLFRLAKQNITLVCLIATTLGLLLVMTDLLYWRSRSSLEWQLKQHLLSVVTIASHQLIGDEIDTLNGPTDANTVTYNELAGQLESLVNSMQDLAAAYIVRPTDTENVIEFVILNAERVTRDPSKYDRTIMETWQQLLPGDQFEITDGSALTNLAFRSPLVDNHYTTTPWGLTISAYAPLHRINGSVAGALVIEMHADDFERLTQNVFSSTVILIIAIIAVVIIAGFIALHTQNRIENMEKMDRDRQAMLTLATHQIGTPLTIIRWYVEALVTDGTLKDNENVTQLQEGIERMNDVIQTLYTSQRIEEGSIKPQAVEVSLCDVLGSVIDSHKTALADKQQKITKHCLKKVKLRVDAKLLAGILHELVSNAINYSPPKSTTTINVEQLRRYVLIRVEDHGFGISSEERNIVFKRFSRGKDALLHQPVGNGMGLFTTQKIVELLGGKIWYETNPGNGTTFFVRLPKI